MADFIKIQNERIRKNTIKKYQPYGETKINVYYNTSRYKIEVQTFTFADNLLAINAIEKLDIEFGL